MAISRQQLAKELEPGLNALFGLEYQNYENQHTEIFDIENSNLKKFNYFKVNENIVCIPSRLKNIL